MGNYVEIETDQQMAWAEAHVDGLEHWCQGAWRVLECMNPDQRRTAIGKLTEAQKKALTSYKLILNRSASLQEAKAKAKTKAKVDNRNLCHGGTGRDWAFRPVERHRTPVDDARPSYKRRR